jgi:tetratricopeptide (TPR) repeat protein
VDVRLNEIVAKSDEADDPKEAVRLIEQALSLLDKKDDPYLWARLQGKLGASMMQMLGRRLTLASFNKVLGAYKAALTVFTPDSAPDMWLATICNVGATYVNTCRSRVGDGQVHINAAIAAFEAALASGQPCESQMRLSVADELVICYKAASRWLGPSAWIRRAEVCAMALAELNSKSEPGNWATFKILRARSLFQSGAGEYIDEVIRECEDGLTAIQRDQSPLDWARAHVLLGACFRTRGMGGAVFDFERAVDCLDKALSLIDPKKNSEDWIEAHYHRGAVYMRRPKGDAQENVESALTSLQIALTATSRAESPRVWAGLQAALGGALLSRANSDPDDIDRAITALEAAFELMPVAETGSLRLVVGDVYLARLRGKRSHNIERAIAILEPLQNDRSTVSGWCSCRAALARAYKMRLVGHPRSNRSHAIELLAPALELGPGEWCDASSWFGAAADLALLYSNLDTGPTDHNPELQAAPARSTKTRPASVAKSSSLPKRVMSLAGLAKLFRGNNAEESCQTGDALEPPFAKYEQRRLESMVRCMERGEPEKMPSEGLNIPYILNDSTKLLLSQFEAFLETGKAPERTAEERWSLGAVRRQRYQLILSHLIEKYTAALRTRELFTEIVRGRKGYVLYLRGFRSRRNTSPLARS